MLHTSLNKSSPFFYMLSAVSLRLVDKPSIVSATERMLAQGWEQFQLSAAVYQIAVPLALFLLDALLGGYFVLRSLPALLCPAETPAGKAVTGGCALVVVLGAHVVLFYIALLVLLVCKLLRDMTPPTRRTRLLLNRE
jgi:hypothetical protein